PVCFAKPAVVSVFVHPAVDVTKHKNLNLVWLDMLPLQYTFGVFEQCHPLEKTHGLPFVEHVREFFRSLSFNVPKEPHAGPFVFLAGHHAPVNHIVRVVNKPLFQSIAHTLPNSRSNGVGSFGGSFGIANFALAAGVRPNSLARARICSASCFFFVISGCATLFVSAALLVYSTINPSSLIILVQL